MDKASRIARSRLSARFTVTPGCGLFEQHCGGIALEARKLELGDGSVALALIADFAGVDDGRNMGMSATSSLELIVRRYNQTILDSLVVDRVIWVEIDSLGGFDLVLRGATALGTQIEWQPLLSGWNPGRTRADFIALFGCVGQEMLHSLRVGMLPSR